MTTYRKFFHGIIWALVFIVIAMFWLFASKFSFNFPFYDDFENIFLFIHKYVRTDGFWNRLALLFEQNFEHRVMFSKLLTLALFKATGQINIKWLILIGDLSLVGTLLLFYKYLKINRLSLISFFTITCLLFQAQHYEDTVSWATCALQHAPCIFFSLCSFYLALNQKNPFFSGLFALLALFSSANGLVAVFIWIAIVLLSSPVSFKTIFSSAILLVISIIHLATLTIHSGSLLQNVSGGTLKKLVLLFSFAGQIADSNLTHDIAPSVILGILFVLPVFIVFWKLVSGKGFEISQLQWFCVAGICALLFVDLLIVFARGTEPDFSGYKMDRYKIYAAYFAIFAVAFYDRYWASFRQGFIVKFSLAGVAFVFCFSSYYVYYSNIINYRNTIEANQVSFSWSHVIYYPIVYKSVAPDYFASGQKRYFSQDDEVFRSLAHLPNWPSSLSLANITCEENSSSLTLRNTSPLSEMLPPHDVLFVAATERGTDQPKYLFTTTSNFKRSFKQFYTTFERPAENEFTCEIFKSKMKKGAYSLYLLAFKDDKLLEMYKVSEMQVR